MSRHKKSEPFRKDSSPVAAVITLGCAKNTVDAEILTGILARRGVPLTSDLDKADVIFLNTCGFLKEAREEAVEYAAMLQEYRQTGRLKRLVITGCMADQDQKFFVDHDIAVDGFLSPFEPHTAVDFVFGDIGMGVPETSSGLLPRIISTPLSYAYLKISDGCDNRCSYCRIPYLRGPFRSRPPDEILEDALEIIRHGRREIVIISQDSASYGKDIPVSVDLADLIQDLSDLSDTVRIRLMYLNPWNFAKEWIRIFKELPQMYRYLDIPVQHVDDGVLKAMNRRISGRAIESLFETLLEAIPGLTLRTTLMTGFPGETASAFHRLKSFVKKGYVQHLGVFVYSHEPNTPLFHDNKTDFVDSETAHARREELMLLQQEISAGFNRKLVGTEQTVLIDEVSGSGSVGRLESQAPEVDGVVRIPVQVSPGTFFKVKITGADPYDLTAEPVDHGIQCGVKGA